MTNEDRERLVRVEENVKAIRQCVDGLNYGLQKHMRETYQEQKEVSNSITALQTKASFLGALGGIISGVVISVVSHVLGKHI